MHHRNLIIGVALLLAAISKGCTTSPNTQAANSSATSSTSRKSYTPVPGRRIAPLYPPRAQYEGVQGDVRLCFTVDPDGSVENIHVVKTKLWTSTSKNPSIQAKRELEAAAIDTLRQWRFKPQRVDGKAIKSVACQDIKFRIDFN